jgi:hypothetical protein
MVKYMVLIYGFIWYKRSSILGSWNSHLAFVCFSKTYWPKFNQRHDVWKASRTIFEMSMFSPRWWVLWTLENLWSGNPFWGWHLSMASF